MMMFAGAAMQLVLATIARGFYDASCAPAGTLTLDALTMPVACREVLRAYGYAAYLFFDFAGYSLMAMAWDGALASPFRRIFAPRTSPSISRIFGTAGT